MGICIMSDISPPVYQCILQLEAFAHLLNVEFLSNLLFAQSLLVSDFFSISAPLIWNALSQEIRYIDKHILLHESAQDLSFTQVLRY